MMSSVTISTRLKSTNAETAIFLLCGIIVFSPMSSMITMDVLRLPIALPELPFVPFYFYLKRYFDFSVNIKQLIFTILLILTLISISIVANNFRIGSVLSTSRGYAYMALAFSIFYNKKINSLHPIMVICFGSMLGWLFLGVLSFKTIIYGLVTDEATVVYGNMIGLSLAIALSVVFKVKRYFVLAFLAGLSISFTSGLRRQILIFVVSFAISVILTMKLSVSKAIKTTVVTILAILIISPLFITVKQELNVLSPFLYYRIFEKSEKLISGELTEGDVERVSSFNDFAQNIENFIIPHGFVSKRTLTDEGTGVYMDSPYIELFYTFGIPGCLIFLIIFIRSLHFQFKNYYYLNIKESAVCIVSGFIIINLLLIEGSFLNYAYNTPLTGYVLARIFSRTNLSANEF